MALAWTRYGSDTRAFVERWQVHTPPYVEVLRTASALYSASCL